MKRQEITYHDGLTKPCIYAPTRKRASELQSLLWDANIECRAHDRNWVTPAAAHAYRYELLVRPGDVQRAMQILSIAAAKAKALADRAERMARKKGKGTK
jgi:hypothetical protein